MSKGLTADALSLLNLSRQVERTAIRQELRKTFILHVLLAQA